MSKYGMTVPPRGPKVIRNKETGMAITLPPVAAGVPFAEARASGDFLRGAGFNRLNEREAAAVLDAMPTTEIEIASGLLGLLESNPTEAQHATRKRLFSLCFRLHNIDSAAYRHLVLETLSSRQIYLEGEPSGNDAATYNRTNERCAWQAESAAPCADSDNPVADFVRQYAETKPRGRIRTVDFIGAFDAWARENGARVWDAAAVRDAMQILGYRKIKSNGQQVFTGLTLKTTQDATN